MVSSKPVAQSEPPVPKRRSGAALSPSQQKLLIDSATGGTPLVCYPRWRCVDFKVTIADESRAGLQRGEELVFQANCASQFPVKALEVHRDAQKISRDQFSSAYYIELDLIFAEPDGAPLKPNSTSASVSALFKRLKIPKSKGASLHLPETLPRGAPFGRRHGTSRRVRTAGPQFGHGDYHRLLAPAHWKRPGSRYQVG